MKLSKTGSVLGLVSLVATVVAIAFEVFQPNGRGSGGWLMLGPILWNFPSSLLVMLLLPFKFSDIFLGLILSILGAGQWYAVGCLIGRVLKRKVS